MAGSNKVRIITLGCAKNEVDSEEIAGVLRSSGHEISADPKSEITIINTCGFLEASKQESLEAIRKAVRSKGKGKVIVAGCLAQRLGPEIQRLAPGADAYLGVGQMARMSDIVATIFGRLEPLYDIPAPQHLWADVPSRARTDKPWSAYLKISEGCDHRCTFCTIPSFRGRHQSKPIERVVQEANHLVRTGAKELNLIAQDVTQYGYDLYREFSLPKLLRDLARVDGAEWIRLLYFYPNRLTPEVIEAIAEFGKVLNYIDIPLQHTHPDVLRRMKRPWDGDRYLRLFEQLRAALPDCVIRTTLIVGFPGESDAEFKHLMDFTRAARLDRVGAFLFSKEEGTPSAEMPGQVPHRIKKQRYDQLMRLQQGISLEKNRHWVGKELTVLIDEVRDGWSAGRSYRDAPEIDGQVYVRGEHQPGSFVRAVVEEATEYDLYGSCEADSRVSRRPLRSLRQSPPPQPK